MNSLQALRHNLIIAGYLVTHLSSKASRAAAAASGPVAV
jgi:hypothetical protein